MVRIRYVPAHKPQMSTKVSALVWNRPHKVDGGSGYCAAAAALLAPAAASAFALGAWALAQQAAFAGNFPVTEGAFADWRVWLWLSALLELVTVRLRRAGGG
jgi:hypothetical protein